MNTTTPTQSGRGLRTLHLTVNGLRLLLIVVTAMAVPLMILATTDRGSITFNGLLDAPYTLAFDDGRSLEVAGDSVSYVGFPDGEHSQTFSSAPRIEAPIQIPSSDLNSRAIVITMFAGWIGAAWLGLVNLRRLVRSALDAVPFSSQNPGRLRWLGIAILSVPVLTGLGNAILARTVEYTLPVSVAVDRGSWLTMLVAGVGMLALAEIFAEAVRLREFEESTI